MTGRSADGNLRYRNPVFRHVFDAEFSKSSTPVDWQRPALLAAVVLIVLGLPYWYLSVLPRPYIETLTVVSQDVALAEAAYDQLRQLPGFGSRADRLLAEAMVRRSEQAASIDAVMAADRVLRRLPEQEGLADRMLAGYWLRSAAVAMHAGDRDSALIYSMAAEHGRPDAARALAVELIDDDYPHLEATFRTTGAPADWAIDWEHDQIVVIDEARRVRHYALGRSDAASPAPRTLLPGRLTAVQHVEVQREITVDADGTAGAFALMLTMQHGRASDLRVRLTSPSGASTEFPVPQPRADQQSLIFNARRGSPLATLSDESIRGQWLLTLVDRRSAEQGVLTRWGLQFQGGAGISWDDEPEQGVPIPDPVRTEQADAALAPGGAAVVSVPSRAGASGAISVRDLGDGALRGDIEVDAPPALVRLVLGGSRLITVDGGRAMLHDVDTGRVLTEVVAETTFAVPPAVSPDERFVAFAARSNATDSTVTLVDMESGETAGTFDVRTPLTGWVLASGGRWLAIVDESRWLRVLDARSGDALGELMHQRRLHRLAPLTEADLIVAVDSSNAVFAWPIATGAEGFGLGDGQFLGVTGDPLSVAVADRARRVVFSGAGNRVELREIAAAGLHGTSLRIESPRRASLSATGEDVVVEGAQMLRRWHVGAGALKPLPERIVSAVAVDPSGAVAALGYRAGHMQLDRLDAIESAAEERKRVDYIGHRGAVTSIDVARAYGIAASGGDDGVVRIWDLASVAPNEYFLRHPEGPVTAVRISPDGTVIASGAEYSARIWQVRSGELVAEVPVDGSVTALAFAPGGDLLAVGDSAGNLFLGSPRGADVLRSVRLGAAVTAIAFSADGMLLAAADTDGALSIWNVAATDLALAATRLNEAARWIGFDETPGGLLVGTDDWLHAARFAPGAVTIEATRMRPLAVAGVSGIGRTGPSAIRVVAADASGGAVNRAVPLRRPRLPGEDPATPVWRNWASILALELDAATGTVRPATD